MPSPIHPQLSHCGVYARDIDAMVAFYTKTIGLVVSDRGISSRGGDSRL
jgi:catechol 2,3-dioxygenase-like lactoylglutathione lyase family enzyme